MRGLVAFLAFTYGAELPDDDAGREDLFILAHHVARLNGDQTRNIANYARKSCPWMGDDEIGVLVRRVLFRPIKWTAETLGQRLGLLNVVRTKLGITTIRPIDATREQLERQRRDRANAKRRTSSRVLYEGGSLTKAAPWKTEGVSRATWYRRQVAVRQVSVSKDSCEVTHTCLNPLRVLPQLRWRFDLPRSVQRS